MTPWMRAYWTAKGVGWENLPRRVLQMLRQRSGLLGRRLASERFTQQEFASHCSVQITDQSDTWAERKAKFLPMPSQADLRTISDDIWDEQVLQICQQGLDGHYPFFSAWTGDLGWPPDFNRDPVHDIDWPVGQHWLTFAHSGPPRDDIKLVWEPSRFTLAYHLARAYRRDADERWADAFWRMFDAWLEQNPPQLSAAWACGQEMTFRLMAMLFAGCATLGSSAATAERLYALTRLAWQTGRHIETNINYARSQGNNHAISEAAGLWTIGFLFPEFAEAEKWHRKGMAILAAECNRQIYDDGSYVQNSMNYHRVTMDDLLWVFSLARQNEITLPAGVRDRFERATRWLAEMIDVDSGRAPNYGANDGANVLPLSCCDYLDYRPTAQAAHLLLQGTHLYGPGPWDEKALWVVGAEAVGRVEAQAPAITTCPKKAAVAFPDGGYYILRGPNSWCMTRCHTYRRRPSQADMLHVDLWANGMNILRDAGSYVYYHRDPEWMHYFKSTAAHNTVEIDGQDQMVKGPRFLWFNWTRSRVLEFAGDEQTSRFVGEHYGYRRLPGSPVHRRTIERNGDNWAIADEILGSGEHEIALRWRLIDADWLQDGSTFTALALQGGHIMVTVPSFVVSNLSLERGQQSQFYGEKRSCHIIAARASCSLPISIVTSVRIGSGCAWEHISDG